MLKLKRGGDKMENNFITIEEEIKENLYVRFKKSFTVDSILNAKIEISADDYYKLYINGEYIGQGPAPSYDFDYAYNEYDITRHLKIGKNTIEVFVYYQGLINRVWVSGDGKMGLTAELYINNKPFLKTDNTWQYQIDKSFIGSKIYGYDTAFSEDRDLRTPPSEYKNAVEAKFNYTFEKEPFPVLEVYSKRANPIIKGNKYFYDFGEEYVGNLRITAEGQGKIIIRLGEELENGKVKHNMRCGCNYEEACYLNNEANVIEQYDYKAFRYVEIEAENAKILDVELLIRHFPFPEKAWDIQISNKNIRAVFELCKSTVKYGTQEAFIDCPTREKGQYLGDTFISGIAHMYLTNDSRLIKRAIKSFSNSVKFSGKLLAVSNCSYKQEIADYSLLFPLMLWKYYNFTKDRDFLLEMLPCCDFICEYYKQFENSNHLLENANEQWNLVDWPESLRDNYEFADVHNVINAFYYSCVNTTEKIKAELIINFTEHSGNIKNSYNKEFLSPNGLYRDNSKSENFSVHSNMLPLAFGISNDEKIADYLIERGMRCGVYMSYFYLKALCNAKRYDDAINTIASEEKNSWINMINEGATRCFEAWSLDQKHNTSLFHPWASAPILILYELDII